MYGGETTNTALHHDTHQHQTHIDDDDDVATAIGGRDSLDGPTPHIRSMETEFVNSAVSGSGAYDQLLLSFQGEIYVFDAVSPQKVQAVLLLLGGSQVPATGNGTPAVSVDPQSQRASGDFPVRLNQRQRPANRKRTRYSVRQQVARRMQRKKGRFVSSKLVSDESSSSSADWNEGSDQEEQETSRCTHCGVSSKSTPQMRCGPAGPGSLCNACGLTWAKKGTLRDISEIPFPGAQDQPVKSGEQITGEPNGSDTMAAAAIITPDGDNPVVVAERILRRLQSLLMTITSPNFAEIFSSHAASHDQNSITSQDLPKNDSAI